jgi:pilus assembly protein FimV
VDLDLDFDLDFEPQVTSESEAAPSSLMGVLHESDVANVSEEPIELFNAPEATASAPIEPDFSATASTSAFDAAPKPVADLLLPELPALSEQTTPLKVKSQIASSPEASPEMLSFDLGSLSLDLDTETPAASAPVTAAQEADTDNLDPLSTKLALAREFQSIGDNDGAHALAEEVYALASGDLRAQAKRFLSELGFAQSGFSTSTF